MEQKNYKPEEYWNSVAYFIKQRKSDSVLAGDEEPYYLYKRKKFLKLLHGLSVKGKNVLEIGCGPGGNLKEILEKSPRELVGVDISEKMVELSCALLKDYAEIKKINGTDLPFDSGHFELVFTSTVLQHVTEEEKLSVLIKEACRVCSDEVVIFERIEKTKKISCSNVGRTISDYKDLFATFNFDLIETRFLNIHWSWLIAGGIRKVFNPAKRKEGEKQTSASKILQKAALYFTKLFDTMIPVKRDLAMLRFKKINMLAQ